MSKKRIQHKLEYVLLEFFVWLFNSWSTEFGYKFCEGLGKFAYRFFPKRKLTAFENIKQAFPDKSETEIWKIVEQVYINCAYFFLESVIAKRLSKDIDNNVQVFGLDKLKKAVDKGKGVVLYTAHIGNWHVMGHKLVAEGFVLNNVVKRQRNAKVFDKEVEAMLESGMKVTVLQKTPKNIFKALKGGDVVEFLADQDAGDTGIFIDFFGKKASTAIGPALFSLKMQSPIVFAVDIRKDEFRHEVYIETIDFETTGDMDADVYTLTKILTKKLEQYIIKYPDQYFWLHKRWNTRER